MRRSRLNSKCILSLLALGVIVSSVPLGTLSALAQTATSAQATPEIHTYTLPSGQRLYVKEDHDQPIVTLDTWVTTGSVNEVNSNNGVSHFLEHLIFKGTDEFKTGEIDRLLESKGAKFNAATSDDFTHYYITTATPYFEEALKLHASMLNRATIPVDELNRERKVVQEEINRATDNPNHKRFDALSKLLYGAHGYGLDTLGPKSNIANIPRESILGYYQHWYQPKNFHTVIVGDVNPEQVKTWVEKLFSSTASATSGTALTEKVGQYTPPVVNAPIFGSIPKTKIIIDPSVTQAYLTLGIPGPSIEQREDVFPLDVAMSVLGAGKSSRLYSVLHEEKPLTLSVSAGNMTQKYSGILFVDAEMKSENRAAVKDEILKQLNRLKKEGVTQEELTKAKTQAIKDFIFHNEATEGVANSIGYNVSIGKLTDYTDYVNNIQKVTQADVLKALNTYLDFKKAILVELLPPTKTPVAKLESDNLKWLASANSPTTSPAPKTSTLTVVSKATPQKEVLANGLTLITKPLKDSNTVALKIFIKGGQSVEPTPGLSALTADLLMTETQGRTRSQINEELEGRGMNLSVDSHEDYIEVSATSISEDFGELFVILQDVLKNPTFNPTELEKQKTLLRQSILANQDNPSSIAMENFTDGVYPNHPYGNVGKRIEPHLKDISQESVRAFYQSQFQPQNMIVSVVGNFDPATVKNYLKSSMPEPTVSSNTPPISTTTKPSLNLAPITKETVIDEHKPIKGATWIVKGWQVPAIGNRDYAALKILNSYLGTGMSSQLFVNLREKQGLAYVVSSAYPTLAQAGHFFMFIGTDPKNRETVLKGFETEIDQLKNTAISPEALKAAKDKMIGGFALAHETNASQAFYLGFYETMGVGYQFDAQYPSLLEKVTSADIQRVAQTYFSQPNVLSIVSPLELSPKTMPKKPELLKK
jgi:zinc protease